MKIEQREGIYINGTTNGSTDLTVLDSTGALYGNGIYARSGSTAVQVASSTGLTYNQGVPIAYVETVAVTSAGASPSTVTPYGLTYCVPNTTGGDFSTSARTIVVGAPIPGVPKVIRWGSTGASANTLWVDLTTNCGVMDSTGGSSHRYISFSTLGTQPQTLNLLGISTSVWMVTSVDSTIPGFENAAGGIHAEAAVESSG